jgi:hypothetical protein
VFAEATGMLTLPPDRPVLVIGNVEIRLKDPSQAATEPKWVTTSTSGVGELPEGFRLQSIDIAARDPNWTVSVPQSLEEFRLAEQGAAVALLLKVAVEAATAEDASEQGYAAIETMLVLAMLASGGQIAPARVTRIDRVSPSGDERITTLPWRGVGSKIVPWTSTCDSLVPTIAHALSMLFGDDAHRMWVALHWRRRASMEQQPATQFLFFWLALDALASMSFSNSTRPGDRSKIIHLLAHTEPIWSDAAARNHYRFRCDVVHGDCVISPKEEAEMQAVIPDLHGAAERIVHKIIRGEY